MKSNKAKRIKKIIDTNVIINAGKRSSEMSSVLEVECCKKCLLLLKNMMRDPDKHGVILDVGNEIIKEYKRNVSRYTLNRLSSDFIQWILTTQLDRMWCEGDIVPIAKQGEFDYFDFPIDDRLSGFDKSDRKFVALSRAHPEHPIVMQASDSKWEEYRAVFAEYGVVIEYVHAEYIMSMFTAGSR